MSEVEVSEEDVAVLTYEICQYVIGAYREGREEISIDRCHEQVPPSYEDKVEHHVSFTEEWTITDDG